MYKMTLRERVSLLVCGIFVVGASYLYLFYLPALDNIERLKGRIVKREVEIEKIRELKEVYLNMKREVRAVESRLASGQDGFSSLTYIETVAEKAGVHENITAITPQSPLRVDRFKGSTHEIKVENVELSKIIDYIYYLENSEYLIKVDRLSIEKRYGVEERFDARMVVTSFETA